MSNVVDLHLARDATELHVEISAESWVTVRDDGRGIPVDLTPDGRPVLEVVLTQLHAKSTWDGHHPHVHVAPGV